MDQGVELRLTAAELAQLWFQYMSDSGSICVLSHFLEKAEDDELRPLIAHCIHLSVSHIEKLTEFFVREDFQVPHGFRVDEDVDLAAPRLYSDSYVLNFIHHMAKIGLTSYAASLASAVREDISEYYAECMAETMDLYIVSKDLLLAKGLFVRSPHLPNAEKVEFVKKQGFLWDIVGEKRPLIALEISNLYANILRNSLGAATLVGFYQVAQAKDVRQFFVRGIEIAKKHIKLFGEKLEGSDLTVPMTLATEITTSTSYTFSDKLMMFYTSSLIGLSVGYYGTSISQSPRVDLGVLYNRLSLEVQLYSEDGANIMIKNRWLEEPPMAANRKSLVRIE
jgi:hypothetical protein